MEPLGSLFKGKIMLIEITSSVFPTKPFTSVEDYFQWVSANAFDSYKKQYETTDLASGLQAAMDAFNASMFK